MSQTKQVYYSEILKLIVCEIKTGQGSEKQMAVQPQSSHSKTESQVFQEIAVYSPKCRFWFFPYFFL